MAQKLPSGSARVFNGVVQYWNGSQWRSTNLEVSDNTGTFDPADDQTITGDWDFTGNLTKDGNIVWHAGNDGTGSGLDADLLDGLHATSFLRSDLDDETNSGIRTWFGGNITGQDTSTARIQINGFQRTGNIYLHHGGNTPDNTRVSDILGNFNGTLQWRGNTVWHSNNDGSGSGLDADTVDNLHASQFLRSDADDTTTGTITISKADNEQLRLGYGVTELPFIGFYHDTTQIAAIQAINNFGFQIWNEQVGSYLQLAQDTTLSYNDGTTLQTVWHSGNDGAGSGLDADTLDTYHASSFPRKAENATITGAWKINNNLSVGGTHTATEALDVVGSGLLSGNMQAGTHTFSSGFAGAGSLWTGGSGDTEFEVDQLTVRGRMDIYELVVNKVRATNGTFWVTDSQEPTIVLPRADLDAYSFNVYFDPNVSPAVFVNNDIIKCQRFSGIKSGGGAKVIEIIGRIDLVGADYYRVRTSGYSNTLNTDTDAMELAGRSVWVRIGNSTDSARRGSLLLTSSESGAPYMDVLDGVTDASLSGHTRVRLGKLDGTGESGYGIWGSNNGSDTDFVISSDGYAQIAGWEFNSTRLKSPTNLDGGYLELDSLNEQIRILPTGDPGEGMVRMYYTSGTDWGLQGLDSSGSSVFELGSDNTIAGWGFDNTKFFTTYTRLKSGGDLELVRDGASTAGASVKFFKLNGTESLIGELNTKFGSGWAYESSTNGLSLSLEDSSSDRARTSLNIYTNSTFARDANTVYANAKFGSKGRKNPETLQGSIDATDVARYDIVMVIASVTLPQPSPDLTSNNHFFNGKKFTIINKSAGTITISGTAITNPTIGVNYARTFVYYSGSWHPYFI